MARQRDEIDKRYKTQTWQRTRLVIIERDKGLCQECKRRGIFTRGNIVHHKIEAREDITKFYDEDNLECICYSCHNKEHPERSGGKKKVKPKTQIVKFYANNER